MGEAYVRPDHSMGQNQRAESYREPLDTSLKSRLAVATLCLKRHGSSAAVMTDHQVPFSSTHFFAESLKAGWISVD
jgi:hypothetical protein